MVPVYLRCFSIDKRVFRTVLCYGMWSFSFTATGGEREIVLVCGCIGKWFRQSLIWKLGYIDALRNNDSRKKNVNVHDLVKSVN